MKNGKSVGYWMGYILGAVLFACLCCCIGGAAIALTIKFLQWII